MGIGRFLNKRLQFGDGFAKSPNEEAPAVVFDDSGNVVSTGPLLVEGNVTATNAGVNQLQVKGGNALTAAWRTIYTWDIPAIAAINVGSINSIVTQDVAMSGAAIGDAIYASPIGSINALVNWIALCISANNVQLKAWYTGSITLTPGNVPFKIVDLKL